MKGKPEVIEALSDMLKEELGAINQYFLHAEMCENWGYKRLAELTKKQAIGEMKHAEAIIERILFLEGLRSEEHTSELQSRSDLVCRLLLEKKKKYDKSRLAQIS